MGILYHGSSTPNLKTLTPHRSTHGTYVYATNEKSFAIIFSSTGGDDQVLTIYRNSSDEPLKLVERIPNVFNTIFSKSSSIYEVDDSTFKNINTGFSELVSTEEVPVLKEEHINFLIDKVIELANSGQIELYYYPNRPKEISPNDIDLIEKELKYYERHNLSITKDTFNRVILLHPNLIDKVNEVLKNYLSQSFSYTKDHLVSLFDMFIILHLSNPTKEYFLLSILKNIENYYPDLCLTLLNHYSIISKSKEEIINWVKTFIISNLTSSKDLSSKFSNIDYSKPLSEIVNSFLTIYKEETNLSEKEPLSEHKISN
ncbi:MAG TPA: hypothetical protein DCE23_07310 [Firmicutes bacterium]|nr:hypothetical protein [Bacillota bacterium]